MHPLRKANIYNGVSESNYWNIGDHDYELKLLDNGILLYNDNEKHHVAYLAPLVHALYVGVQHLLVVLSSEEAIFAPGRNM